MVRRPHTFDHLIFGQFISFRKKKTCKHKRAKLGIVFVFPSVQQEQSVQGEDDQAGDCSDGVGQQGGAPVLCVSVVR